MATVFAKIQELEEVVQLSKHEQLVNGIINAIDEKIVVQGSMLPSVNMMVKELGFANRTIAKAYKELKERGIVESKNRLGYFVLNEDTEQNAKVALLMYAFHPFQEVFYNSFRSALGDNVQLDVFFHHSNMDVFENMLHNIKGRYGVYVITPIPHPRTKKLLQDIPENKLLIVDRFEPISKSLSHVTQEFEISTYMALKELLPTIKKFNEIILCFLSNADYPLEILSAFNKFIKDYKIKGKVVNSYAPNSLKKGQVYFTIGDGDLWRILKECIEKKFEIGKDIGVFSSNDSAVKEFVCGGVTTLSTDFEIMAQRAAEFVLNRAQIQTVIPTVLKRRKSL